eukprot:5129022-Prymnesium_polylepis.1
MLHIPATRLRPELGTAELVPCLAPQGCAQPPSAVPSPTAPSPTPTSSSQTMLKTSSSSAPRSLT